jgi:hypothetical protein
MNLKPAWSETPAAQKRHVQAMVPEQIHRDLFYKYLPGYGTAACILSHLMEAFYVRFEQRRTMLVSASEYEELAQQILRELKSAPELPKL